MHSARKVLDKLPMYKHTHTHCEYYDYRYFIKTR